MIDIVTKEPICIICGLKITSKINKHIYKIAECKECQHAYAIIEEDNYKKIFKTDSIEDSFCPYLFIIKNIHKYTFKVYLYYNDFSKSHFHYFSEKSIQYLFLKMNIDFEIETKDKEATIRILRLL